MADDTDDLESLVLSTRHPQLRLPHKRQTQGPLVSFERELTPEDLARVEAGEPPPELTPSPLERLKYKHQMAARLLADGLTAVEVGYATGYTPQYINNFLVHDPAFQELVEHFQSQKAHLFIDAHIRVGTLAMTTVERMQERIDSDELSAELGMLTLKAVAEMALDRSVAPPKGGKSTVSTVEGPKGPTLSVNINFAEPPKGQAVTLDILPNSPEPEDDPT